jgi:hypothetical protein
LKALRVVKRVRIEGTVTEAWALYLESVMTGSEGDAMGEFEHEERAKDALKYLMKLCQ